MAYEKRVLVLRQIRKGFSADGSALSGVVYAERLGSELTVTLRIPGLSPLKEGRYLLVLRLKGSFYCLALGEGAMKIQDAPSVKEGFSALLCFVRGEAVPVAFGNCGAESGDYSPLLAALTENTKKKPLPTPMPPFQTPAPLEPNVPFAPGVPLPGPDPDGEEKDSSPFREHAASYDDEAIAQDNYFSSEDEDGAGEVPEGGQGQKAEDPCGPSPHADDTLLFPRGSLTYYGEVREKLEAVMKTYPPDTRLKWAFPHSEWVRSEDRLIGVIYEEGIPRYLCVAAEYGDGEVMENATFVPATPFSDEKGFWVVFQDADTGAYVKVENG